MKIDTEIFDFIYDEFLSCEMEAQKQGAFKGPWEPTSVDFDWVCDRVKERFDPENPRETVTESWRVIKKIRS